MNSFEYSLEYSPSPEFTCTVPTFKSLATLKPSSKNESVVGFMFPSLVINLLLSILFLFIYLSICPSIYLHTCVYAPTYIHNIISWVSHKCISLLLFGEHGNNINSDQHPYEMQISWHAVSGSTNINYHPSIACSAWDPKETAAAVIESQVRLRRSPCAGLANRFGWLNHDWQQLFFHQGVGIRPFQRPTHGLLVRPSIGTVPKLHI